MNSELTKIDELFGQEDIYMWSTYILPNGHFLNPENCPEEAQPDYDWIYEHEDFDSFTDINLWEYCLKMNVTYPYIALPTEVKWTKAQQNALIEILEHYDQFAPDASMFDFVHEVVDGKYIDKMQMPVLITTPVGDKAYDAAEFLTPEEIVKDINKALVRGGFGSSYDLDEQIYTNKKNSILTEDLAAVKLRYPEFNQPDFDSLIELDPTFKRESDSLGTYGKWILAMAKKGFIEPEDETINELLFDFNKNKKWFTNKDIFQFKSPRDLRDAVMNVEVGELTATQKRKQAQKARHNVDLTVDADLVYEDSDWTVQIPKTYAASCKLGLNTEWCTATTERSTYYEYYSKQGPLYIIINKKDPLDKYQFHFESSSYMNAQDRSIELMDFLEENLGLKSFFTPKILDKYYKDMKLEVPETRTSIKYKWDFQRFLAVLAEYKPQTYYHNERLSGEFITQAFEDPFECYSFDPEIIPSFIKIAESVAEMKEIYKDPELAQRLKKAGVSEEDFNKMLVGEYFANTDEQQEIFDKIVSAAESAYFDCYQAGVIQEMQNDIIKDLYRGTELFQLEVRFSEDAVIVHFDSEDFCKYILEYEDSFEWPGSLDNFETALLFDLNQNLGLYEPHYGRYGFDHENFIYSFDSALEI